MRLYAFLFLCSFQTFAEVIDLVLSVDIKKININKYSVSLLIDNDNINLDFDKKLEKFKEKTFRLSVISDVPDTTPTIENNYILTLSNNESYCTHPNSKDIVIKDFISLKVDGDKFDFGNSFESQLSQVNADGNLFNSHTVTLESGKIEHENLFCNGLISIDVELGL